MASIPRPRCCRCRPFKSSSPPGPGLSSKMDDKAVLECLFQNEAKALAESLAWQREQRQILLDAQREAIRALFVKDHGVDSNGIEVRDEDGDGEGHDESGPVLLPRTPKVTRTVVASTKRQSSGRPSFTATKAMARSSRAASKAAQSRIRNCVDTISNLHKKARRPTEAGKGKRQGSNLSSSSISTASNGDDEEDGGDTAPVKGSNRSRGSRGQTGSNSVCTLETISTTTNLSIRLSKMDIQLAESKTSVRFENKSSDENRQGPLDKKRRIQQDRDLDAELAAAVELAEEEIMDVDSFEDSTNSVVSTKAGKHGEEPTAVGAAASLNDQPELYDGKPEVMSRRFTRSASIISLTAKLEQLQPMADDRSIGKDGDGANDQVKANMGTIHRESTRQTRTTGKHVATNAASTTATKKPAAQDEAGSIPEDSEQTTAASNSRRMTRSNQTGATTSTQQADAAVNGKMTSNPLEDTERARAVRRTTRATAAPVPSSSILNAGPSLPAENGTSKAIIDDSASVNTFEENRGEEESCAASAGAIRPPPSKLRKTTSRLTTTISAAPVEHALDADAKELGDEKSTGIAAVTSSKTVAQKVNNDPVPAKPSSTPEIEVAEDTAQSNISETGRRITRSVVALTDPKPISNETRTERGGAQAAIKTTVQTVSKDDKKTSHSKSEAVTNAQVVAPATTAVGNSATKTEVVLTANGPSPVAKEVLKPVVTVSPPPNADADHTFVVDDDRKAKSDDEEEGLRRSRRLNVPDSSPSKHSTLASKTKKPNQQQQPAYNTLPRHVPQVKPDQNQVGTMGFKSASMASLASASKNAHGVNPSSTRKLISTSSLIIAAKNSAGKHGSNRKLTQQSPVPLSAVGSSGGLMSRLKSRVLPMSPIKAGSSNILNMKSFFAMPERVAKPTEEEIQAKKEDELEKKKQKELEAVKRKEEMDKARQEKRRLENETRQKRVMEARIAQEKQELRKREAKETLAKSKKMAELHRKEKERKMEEERKRRLQEEQEQKRLAEEEKLRQQAEEQRLLEIKKLEEAEALRKKQEAAEKLRQLAQARLNQTYQKEMGQQNANVTKEAKNDVSSYDMTPARHELPPEPLVDKDNYDIGDLRSDEDTDEEDDPRKQVPAWACGGKFRALLAHLQRYPPDVDQIFQVMEASPNLTELFKEDKKWRYVKRTSSAVWERPPTTHKY